MASVLGAIQTQLATDITTTSIDKTYLGFVESTPSTYPYAEIHMGGGEIGYNITSQIDVETGFEVYIYGTSMEQVQLAIEEITALWFSATKRAVLAGLGAINILPVSPYPPIVFAPSSATTATTQRPLMGALTFEMTVRYTV